MKSKKSDSRTTGNASLLGEERLRLIIVMVKIFGIVVDVELGDRAAFVTSSSFVIDRIITIDEHVREVRGKSRLAISIDLVDNAVYTIQIARTFFANCGKLGSDDIRQIIDFEVRGDVP